MATHHFTKNLSDDQQTAIKAAVEKKGAVAACGRCDNQQMRLLDSLVSVPSFDPTGDQFGPVIPAAALACTNCGNLVLHAVPMLEVGEELGIQ